MAAIYSNGGNRCNILGFNFNKRDALSSVYKISMDYTHFNEQSFLRDVQAINWNLETLDRPNNVNSMFDKFNSDLMKIVDNHIPLKQLSRKTIKNMAKPRITPGIRASLKIKNNFYKRYINTRSPYYFSKVKSYRNRLNRLIRISKRDYYNNYFINNKNMKNI